MNYTKDWQDLGLDMQNRLFCSFSQKDRLDSRLHEINREYKIMYGKIFVLSSPESEEYMITYNVEPEGKELRILENTILLHRKKETNTLYTINALNTLVKMMNNGMHDPSFPIPWKEYQNSVLLTNGSEFRKLNTVIHKIITV